MRLLTALFMPVLARWSLDSIQRYALGAAISDASVDLRVALLAILFPMEMLFNKIAIPSCLVTEWPFFGPLLPGTGLASQVGRLVVRSDAILVVPTAPTLLSFSLSRNHH